MKYGLRLLALLLFVPVAFADFDEGIEYQKIARAQPTVAEDRIEVLELFWYGCPHCYELEPVLEAWQENKADDVVFVRVPAVLGKSWELGARAYYTAELLDVTDQIHKSLFDRFHKDKKPIRNLGELKDFFVSHGVSAEDFDKTINSFAVVTKTNRAKQVRDMYGISGVPALIVNGKYRTSARLAGSNQKMLEVVDFLIEKERAALAASPQAAAQ